MRLGPMIEGNDTVLRHLAAEREDPLLIVSPSARLAIRKEILPQIEEGIQSIKDVEDILEQTKQAIRTGFAAKSPVYTRLVAYKSIDQSDIQYLADLEHVMDEWGRKTIKRLEEPDEEKDKEDVKVKVEVETTVHTDVSGPGVDMEHTHKEKSEEGEEKSEEGPTEMPYTASAEGLDEQVAEENSPSSEPFDVNDVRL